MDGQTAAEFSENLEERLGELEDCVKAGRWRAPPVRRAYIPKGDGKLRPLGIPTIEDKVLQRAFAMLLQPVFEEEFLDCSYGFRPKRSAHQALRAVQNSLWRLDGGWVLDVDLRSFFDTVDHAILREMLADRVRDGVVRQMIGKWLKAGVLEDGRVHRTAKGTPQGGVISPLLANLYLHHVVDVWFEEVVKPRLRGRASIVRYADDFVMVFEHEADARRVQEVLPRRLERFGLELNEEKTRLVCFEKPTRGGPPSQSFDFLGFTLFWGKSRKGRPTVRWKTSKKSLNKTLMAFHAWCKRYRHQPVVTQHAALSRKLRGHYAYFGLTMNARSLNKVLYAVRRIWRAWLDQRSQRGRMPWPRFAELLRRHPLPPVRVVHSIYRVT